MPIYRLPARSASATAATVTVLQHWPGNAPAKGEGALTPLPRARIKRFVSKGVSP